MQHGTAGLINGRTFPYRRCALLFCLVAATFSVLYSRSQSSSAAAVGHGHTAPVLAVAFSPNGQWLASAGADKTIIVWDVGTGRELRVLTGHTAMVANVVFSPDSRFLISSSLDHSIRIWDPATGKLVQVLSDPENVVSLAVSPDGRLFATACGFRIAEGGCKDPSIHLWNFPAAEISGRLAGHHTGIRALAFSPDGRMLASGGEDATIRLWDVQNRISVWSVTVPLGAYALSFSLDNKLLAAQENSTIRVLDVATGRQMHSLNQPYGGQGVAFSSNGRWLASTGADPYLTLWDLRTWSPVHRLTSEGLNCRGVSFSPDSKLLAAGCSDNTVRLFVASSLARAQILGHAAPYRD